MNDFFQPFFSVPMLDRLVNFGILAASAVMMFFGIRDILRAVKVRLPDGTTFTPMVPDSSHPPAISAPPVDPIPPVYSPQKPSLATHKIFAAEAQFITQIGQMDDGSAKGRVSVVFLRDCKFKTIYRHLRKFVADVEASNGSGVEAFPRVLYDITRDYSERAKMVEYNIGNSHICGIPELYLRKFDRWHDPHVTMLMHSVQETLRDGYYYTWWSTCTSCLDILYFVLVLTLDDAKLTLADLNGDVDREIAAKQCRDNDGGIFTYGREQ